ncbi:saccharopine dehydrogenase [gamma proteobacterium HTCC5015]|nr:saccharopine dehydrogenase [gamma proteobacterium HTCC5015]
MTDSRPYDIVILGATGFTGGLTAEYLARVAQGENLRWAIAGRSMKKLDQCKRRLSKIGGSGSEPGLLRCDVRDPQSLSDTVAQARVLITTVGPYIHHGEPVVRACIEQQCDYVDLTGEPEFVDRLRHKYGERAREQGVRIVNCCGFDSIPHDLGALFTIRELGKRVEGDVRGEAIKLEGFVTAGGRFSGGTWHSAVHAFNRWRDYQKDRKYWRKKAAKQPRNSNRIVKAVFPDLRFRRSLGAWAVPFPTIDPQVVMRSAKAIPDYGARFDYGHYVLVRKLPRVLMGVAAVGGIFTLAQINMGRDWLLQQVSQGEGPSESQRERGWFRVVFQGRSSQCRITTQVSGGDPGYDETAKMLAESALCLAKDDIPKTAGIVTPAIAMGDALITRLQSAGIRFEVLA